MGWSFDDHTEFFTLSDLIDKFACWMPNPSPAAINFSNRDYLNDCIFDLTDEDKLCRITPFFTAKGLKPMLKMKKIAPLLPEREDCYFRESVEIRFFFKDKVLPAVEELVPKGLTPAQARDPSREP